MKSPPLPEAIQRYFEVAIYLLVLTGFGTLASTGGLDAPTVVLVGAALIFRGYLLARRIAFFLPEQWTTTLTLAYALFYVVDLMAISGTFLSATVHLVLFVMVIRLLSARRDRDHYFLSVIAFLMVLAAAVLTVDSIFLVSFAVFILMAVGTFILMEMRRSSAQATAHSKETNDDRASRHMAMYLTGLSPLLVIGILLGAAALFFLMPRRSTGYLTAYRPTNEISTGFSDQVQLGRIGQIQQSNEVVMHIQIDGDDQGNYDLKWRGVALNVFDGRNWSNPREERQFSRSPEGSFVLQQPDARWLDSALQPLPHNVHYKVLMEPIGTTVFFLASKALSLEGNYRLIAVDGGGAVLDRDPEYPISRYQGTSNLSTPSPDKLRQASGIFPPQILLNDLQLPALDSRIPRLAESVTANAASDYDKAVAIENYLRGNFGYTLQLSRTTPRDPIADFLFVRKQGHCEYFASSMAVMLRSLRIPTRLVNGFRGGEFNYLTQQYVIRASSAHSWVEAYFPGYGWISFDPTPAGSLPSSTGWNRISLYLDAASSFWRDWVVNYDTNYQKKLGETAARSGAQLIRGLQTWMRVHYEQLMEKARQVHGTVSKSPGKWSLSSLAAAVITLFLANARWLWRELKKHRMASHPEQSPRMAATIWYERMTRRMGRRGWRKTAAQTPVEFVAGIEDPALRKSVEEFTRRYESARFGDSVEDARHLPELYEQIRELPEAASGRRVVP